MAATVAATTSTQLTRTLCQVNPQFFDPLTVQTLLSTIAPRFSHVSLSIYGSNRKTN